MRLRWEELNPSERKNFANLSVDLMSEIADPCEEWPLKSQTAALVAEVFIMMLDSVYTVTYFIIIAALFSINYIYDCFTDN